MWWLYETEIRSGATPTMPYEGPFKTSPQYLHHSSSLGLSVLSTIASVDRVPHNEKEYHHHFPYWYRSKETLHLKWVSAMLEDPGRGCHRQVWYQSSLPSESVLRRKNQNHNFINTIQFLKYYSLNQAIIIFHLLIHLIYKWF